MMATVVQLHRDICESQGLWSLLTRKLPTILLLFNLLIKAVTHILEMVVIGDETPSKDHGLIDWTISICLVAYAVAGVVEEMKLVRHPIFWYAYTILGIVILELQLWIIKSVSVLTMILINIFVVFTTLVCAMYEEKRNLLLICSNIFERSAENPADTPATEV